MYNVSTITINTFNTTAINDSINYKVAAIRTMAITNFNKVFDKTLAWVKELTVSTEARCEVVLFVAATLLPSLLMLATAPFIGVVPAMVVAFVASNVAEQAMVKLVAAVSVTLVAVVLSVVFSTVAALAAIVIGVAHYL
jgi:hypothetical protein